MKRIVESFVPATVAVFDTDASHADLSRLPYVLLLGRTGVRGQEETVTGRDSSDGELTVRAVGRSRRQLDAVLSRIRASLDRHTVRIDGSLLTFTVVDGRGPRTDRDVTIPGTGAPVLFADDVYEISSQPI